MSSPDDIALGLKANLRPFVILVIVNAFVGAMIGLERSLLPEIAEKDFGLHAKVAMFSFIAVFGVTKSVTNYFTGLLADRLGRKPLLMGGWLLAVPIPWLLAYSPSWSGILLANALLGVSQGLCWSTTVIMKIDLVGPKNRGLAMGLNEFAGYLAVASSAYLTAWIAQQWSYRPEPFYLGLIYVAAGLVLSRWFVPETKKFVALEQNQKQSASWPSGSEKPEDIAFPPKALPSAGWIFQQASWKHPQLSAITWAGFVNNLNDGMAWGLFPLLYAALGFERHTMGWLVALYPATWGVFQVVTGLGSDLWGRKKLIVGGMLLQALALVGVASASQVWTQAMSQVLLGLGTAMVYPTFLAAIGDVAEPQWRAAAVGVYRL
ncbi:MAG: MFS transporter, partial [Bdellovibrionaceae bacterium]|nr:MFS transporter [Pseudobdellovibrionaceae bacterium]